MDDAYTMRILKKSAVNLLSRVTPELPDGWEVEASLDGYMGNVCIIGRCSHGIMYQCDVAGPQVMHQSPAMLATWIARTLMAYCTGHIDASGNCLDGRVLMPDCTPALIGVNCQPILSVFPGAGVHLVSCPACPATHPAKAPVVLAIIHLNDVHHWSRDRIADWVDTLPYDLSTIKEEPCSRLESEQVVAAPWSAEEMNKLLENLKLPLLPESGLGSLTSSLAN